MLRRDVRLLESLGAPIPSTANAQLDDAYGAAFATGTPTAQALTTLRSTLLLPLGTTATRARIGSISQLIADAPAFAEAAGRSPSRVETLVQDVQAVVNDGGDESLNPFKVTISQTATGA